LWGIEDSWDKHYGGKNEEKHRGGRKPGKNKHQIEELKTKGNKAWTAQVLKERKRD